MREDEAAAEERIIVVVVVGDKGQKAVDESECDASLPAAHRRAVRPGDGRAIDSPLSLLLEKSERSRVRALCLSFFLAFSVANWVCITGVCARVIIEGRTAAVVSAFQSSPLCLPPLPSPPADGQRVSWRQAVKVRCICCIAEKR